MIEKIFLDYMKAALPVPVYMEVPPDPPGGFVVLEKTGGSKRNFIRHATFAVQAYGKSLHEAAALCDEAWEAAEGMIALPEIFAVSLDGGYNFTDPETKRYRYQAVCYITY